ncbi:unnamed protein product [Adineta steineri]|uniref:RZ-type domain-containing protein n=1 Tax=Adineta steineri TaxID=433720 RepID=A0A813MUX7_9BILA|nr:unnamed protein product [Adineta steineri]CAF0910529.1 unnamed protein product [Adineta steineri]
MATPQDDEHRSSQRSGNVIRVRAPLSFQRSSIPIAPPLMSNLRNSQVNVNDNMNEQHPIVQLSSGVVRHHRNRGHSSNARGGGRQTNMNNHTQSFMPNNNNNNRDFSSRPNSGSTNSTTRQTSNRVSSLPHITYPMLTNLLDKQPDEILDQMLHPNFQLKAFLKDDRMKKRSDWIVTMTRLLEKITTCNTSSERIIKVLEQLPRTLYIEGVYEEVAKLDPITDQLRFDFIQLFLKIFNKFLSITPHSADDLIKISERIELQFHKTKIKSQEFEDTKVLLDEVLEQIEAINYRKKQKQELLKAKMPTTATNNNNNIEENIDPPPDDYRLLPIIPNVTEILSERKPYLRRNIINGVYEDPQHYLDIHFRLLREDFVGPLRDGITQYLSNTGGKNFNVRIYENVRSLGSRLSPRSGIVYDLRLDIVMASKISWVNSRRLIYGNLLVLTYDNFKTCAFVTVEDRTQIEKDFIISVKTLEKINNSEQIQVDLDAIDSSYSLIMIETTTYFEAYRPVLNALQSIDIEHTFPLAPFLLKLSNEMVPPDYITPTTTYDFTPLLVQPNSVVTASVVVHESVPQHRGLGRRGPIQPITAKEFQIRYKQSNQVLPKYKSVSLLKKDDWPTHDELHLNPKQRDALILALTSKVALIQGPPGTGKTFLGVRITEMLLHNRSVWCPPDEQATPILMICHTNHALDQFLELIIKRLNIKEGIIRVGNRCQNATIQNFSLINARKHARESRAIPGHIYHQKRLILDKKTEAEEVLKIHEHKIVHSRTNIIPLSSFTDYSIIDKKHISSLLAPYPDDDYFDIALWDWLGIGQDCEQISEDLINVLDINTSISKMDINDNEKKEEENKVDDEQKQNDEVETQTQDGENKDDDEQQEKKEQEINEEEEEEQRRRDELEIEAEYFVPSAVPKLQSKKSKSTKASSTDNNGDDEWRVVKKKPNNRRRLIKNILQYPTTLTDQTIQQLDHDLWALPTAQRHDLYRYWLLKYQHCINDSVHDAKHEYNKAVTALAEYHQDEDYFILKDSIIVAMTTTCAAKYHTVLEKLQSKIVIVEEAAAIFEAHIITALNTKCEHLILIGDHVQLRPSPSVYELGMKFKIDVSLFERFVKNNFPNVRLNIQHRMRPEVARIMKHFYDDLEDHVSVTTERPPVRGINNNVFFINHSNPETAVADGSSKRNKFEASYVIELAKYLIKQGYQAQQITILVMYLGQRQLIANQAKPIKLLHGIRIMVTDNYQGEENDIIILSLVRSNTQKSIGFLKIHNRICVALSRARCGLFVIGNMTLLAEVEDMWKKIIKSLAETNEIGKGLSLSCRQHEKDKFIADKPESFAQRPEGGCNKPCCTRLKCGHQCELMCHNYDFEHKEVVCRKRCNDILSCGHPCTKRCHAATPNQHDPCRVRVEKTIKQCGHKISFQCARTPTVNDCQQLVLRHLPCGHAVNVPCCIVSSPSELKKFPCSQPCKTALACKHECTGTCGRCRTGQLHIPCQQKCDRPLICSHVCKAPCASNCPPCLKACQTRCVHSQCKKQCGELCTPCKEPCAYKCKHLQCTRLCSEPCNRGPCDQPCDKKLKCGHDCIGICGEPCPPQCRICNKHIVQEIFFGTEEEPDARFVFLPDCEHLIEVSALDTYVGNSINNPSENVAIRFPECPRCKQQIRRCTRYMPIINQVHNLITKVKTKVLGNRTEQEMNDQRIRLVADFEQTKNNLKETNLEQTKAFFATLYNPDGLLSDDILALMKNILLFLKEIDKLLIDGRKRLSDNTFDDLISAPLNHIIKYLTHRLHRNFSLQQTNDIQAELERIRRLIYIETLIHSYKSQILTRTLKKEDQEGLDSMQYLTKKPGPFTEQDKQKFDTLVKKFQHLNNLPGLGITERERLAIVGALSLTQGHWYVCPKGHPYVITECGGASQVSKCPECGEEIGGQNHQLLSTNRHFGLMDGSQHSAWSNDANLNIRVPFL